MARKTKIIYKDASVVPGFSCFKLKCLASENLYPNDYSKFKEIIEYIKPYCLQINEIYDNEYIFIVETSLGVNDKESFFEFLNELELDYKATDDRYYKVVVQFTPLF